MDKIERLTMNTPDPIDDRLRAEADATFLAKFPTFESRAEAMLARVYGGMHHVHGLKKQLTPHPYWSFVHSGSLSTYDWEELTRLVLGAHEYALRVEITNGGPRALKVLIHPRQRGGSIFERHPTIEQAIERWAQTTL